MPWTYFRAGGSHLPASVVSSDSFSLRYSVWHNQVLILIRANKKWIHEGPVR